MGLGALVGVSAAGAVLGAGSAVAGNVMNKKSVDRTNETNMQIAQMNNEWSEKMAEKQMKYNTEMYEDQKAFTEKMWQKTADYNSLENRMQQARDAGVNPYQALGSGAFGSVSASSAPAAGSPGLPSPSQVSAQAPQYDFSNVGSSLLAGLDMYNKLKLGSQQADNLGMDKALKQVELQYKSKQIMQDLANKYSEQKNTEARTKTLNQLRELEKGQMVASTNYTIQQTENLKETMKGVVIQNCMDYLTLKNMPTEIALKNANLAASTAFMVSQRAMSEKQAINEIKKGLILDSQATKEKISADYAELMAKNLYLQAQSTLRRMTNNEGPDNAWKWYDTRIRPWAERPITGSGNGSVYTPGILW